MNDEIKYVELDPYTYFIEFNNACSSGNIGLIEDFFLKSDYFENYHYELGFNNAVSNNRLDIVKFFYKYKKVKITEKELETLVSNASLSTGTEAFQYIVKEDNLTIYKSFYEHIKRRLSTTTVFDSYKSLELFISLLKHKRKPFDLNKVIASSILNNSTNCFNYFYKKHKNDLKNVFFEGFTKELFDIIKLNDEKYFYIFNKLVNEFEFDFNNYKTIKEHLIENPNHFLNKIIQANDLKNSLNYNNKKLPKFKI